MPLKTTFQIVESPTQFLEPITKFGGQPVWIAGPCWPLGFLETGEQMMLIGQIYLNQELFPESDRAIAYLFFSGECDTGFELARQELARNKIGGQSLYIEGLSTPPEQFYSEEGLLLLQLNPTQRYWNNLQPNFYLFHMELGKFGILDNFYFF